MATFKPVTRSNNEFNPVFIRISTKGKVDYIKTSIQVHKSCIENGEITDWNVIGNCAMIIKKYLERLNCIDTESWQAAEIKNFLLKDTAEISFTEFAEHYIMKMQLLTLTMGVPAFFKPLRIA